MPSIVLVKRSSPAVIVEVSPGVYAADTEGVADGYVIEVSLGVYAIDTAVGSGLPLFVRASSVYLEAA